MPEFIDFVKRQFTPLPAAEGSYVDLVGKTVIVSGSNTGLGKEAARHYARMRPDKLILAVRNVEKGEVARQEILSTVPNLDGATIEVWKVDLTEFSSVKAFATRVQKDLTRLDVLLLNAGIVPNVSGWASTSDGWETTLQSNCLATFYLALLLLPFLNKTSEAHYTTTPSSKHVLVKPHLTITASEVHGWAVFPERDAENLLEALNNSAKSALKDRYEVTKLLEVLFVRALWKHADNTRDKVVVTTVNPGLCKTDLIRDLPLSMYMFMVLFQFFLARTAEAGSRTLLWTTLRSEEGGTYSSDCTNVEPSPFVRSEKGAQVQEKLWGEVVAVLSKVDGSIGDIVSRL